MRIGLIAHTQKPGAETMVGTLCEEFHRRGVDLILEERTAAVIKKNSGLPAQEVGKQSDLLLVLGGDGTILQVLQELGEHVKPIFGVNLGSLGFLTCISSSDYLQAVDSILGGSYRLSSRTLLKVEIQRQGRIVATRIGLNDAVISRGAISRLIKLETRIDDVVLTEYNADGLIIATPTGSTAYSLSAGGPVLAPDSGVFVITPICPHVLTNRSVTVSDEACITVEPNTGQQNVFLTVDGQEMEQVNPADVVVIRKAARTVQLAMLPGISFFEVLRQKLKWSGSAV